ncbi:MAG: VOC family protein [Deltaproteobacteria bacterium]|nr:VOC family protein [Deltaproteobacteria bacterium]
MIIPNLMVTDVARSIAFYREIIGMKLAVAIDGERNILGEDQADSAVFATLELDGAQLMVQSVASLAIELDEFTAEHRPTASGTVYFRGVHPETLKDRVDSAIVVKGPFQQWYGMNEIYLRDPDGYILCFGAPEGPPPAG